jgi:UTP--glucose-1-phosphate uridylyltransferase
VVIKLNGGLGTSMGMTRAKSLLEVKDGLSFLDIIARQVLGLRRRHGVRLPLVLMNSFYTQGDTLAALARHPELAADVPPAFVQNKEPKIRTDDLQPVEWPPDPSLEWSPPGHGDLYTALVTSGMLETLLEHGYEHAFVSNADNLGAVLEPRVLGWIAAERIPFAMEVCERTEADRKGGHPARRRGGGLVQRETAQTPEEDLASFQDTSRWRFFNTNNLWMDLRRLAEALEARDNILGLPMIVNRKTVDPADKSTPEVFQLETAMGAAIAVFDDARVVHVPRARFAPVKTTDDLLVVRSDAYVLTDDAEVVLAPERSDGPPYVELDPDHFKLLRDFEARLPAGPPSLVGCDRLVVRGDVVFGRGVVVRGAVEVRQEGAEPLRIEDGAVLEG